MTSSLGLLMVTNCVAGAAPTREHLTVAPVQTSMRTSGVQEENDLASISQSLGITADQARSRFGWQNEFIRAVDLIRARYGDTFSTASMHPAKGVLARVEFTGSIPADVRTLLAPVPVPVEVWGDATSSERELRHDVELTQRSAERTTGTAVSTELGADGSIQVTTYGPSKAAREEVAAAASAATRASTSRTSRRAPKITVTSGTLDQLGAEVTVYGGGPLSSCTSGFTVKKLSGSEKGIVTADHCSDSQNYAGYAVLSYSSRLSNNNGDIQYMRITSGGTASKRFYNDACCTSAQTNVSTPVSGMAICAHGKTTAKTCDTVRSIATCRSPYCNLVSTQHHYRNPGDSGGPWSYGTTVYGVHSGYYTSVLRKRSQFTPLYNTLSQLGITIYK